MKLGHQIICRSKIFTDWFLTARGAISKFICVDAKDAYSGRYIAGDPSDVIKPLAVRRAFGNARAPPARRVSQHPDLGFNPNASFTYCAPARILSGRKSARGLARQARINPRLKKGVLPCYRQLFPQ